ncbi:vitamin K epoxide reductase family protein [Arthrobacter zhaoguopingii]|uniref:vitamin K epoxide reductase family protein n=1 Tax=Arthrobacter zhaoguopingii TaxID=2681491 RepID=UPI00135CB0E8|nr:vitamin K epoxide reductase family protein [Arthrobacter zhaoguopingii]
MAHPAHAAPSATNPEKGAATRRPERRFAFLLVATGVVGWLASGQLVLERLALYADPGYVTSCDLNPWISCGEVFRTQQAAVFGFPNPLIGLVAFAVVITTGMALLAGAELRRWYWLGLQAGTVLGAAFTLWLWFQALFVISILCIYCMVVWVVMIVLTVHLTARNAASGVLPVPPRAARLLAEWSWVLVALLIVAGAASVFLRFAGALLG